MQDILGPFEHKVRKLVEEHLVLRKELLVSMESNRSLKQTIQTLLLEIDQLKSNPVISEEELEAQQMLQDAYAQALAERDRSQEEVQQLIQDKQQLELERRQLMDALENIQNEISTIQNNSDTFFQEYDEIKQSLQDQQAMHTDAAQRIEDLEMQVADHVQQRDRIVLENESLKIQLEASKEANRELKELAQKRQEFENQEKSTSIVESIAEDGIQRNEIKLKINEYIKEIDKCIAQLNE
ncbi:MAG: hypothetical protein MUF42_03180 [Cytophagaceae bacterium]|jgi:chromosome segregation ATPase|nr:hypothetical protein [Cytophagaceae bacterium]